MENIDSRLYPMMKQLPEYSTTADIKMNDIVIDPYSPPHHAASSNPNYDPTEPLLGRVDYIRKRGNLTEITLGTVLKLRKNNNEVYDAERLPRHITTADPLYKITEDGEKYLKENQPAWWSQIEKQRALHANVQPDVK